MLNDFNLRFLKEVFADMNTVQPLVARVVHLYKEIRDKAVENEKTT